MHQTSTTMKLHTRRTEMLRLTIVKVFLLDLVILDLLRTHLHGALDMHGHGKA